MKAIFSFAICTSSLFALPVEEFPQMIDFNGCNYKLFQQNLLYEPMDSWNARLGQVAYYLGYCAFNDAPEIGTFISLLKDTYEIDIAVETGTNIGSTTAFFSLCFPQVYTVELNDDLYEQSKELLRPCSNVVTYHGESSQMLRGLLPTLKDKRILFYLDAHGAGHCPLLDELEEIGKTHKNNCVVVIDDFKVPGRRDIPCDQFELGRDFTHHLIQSRLQKIFTQYSVHYLIPKDLSRKAKFVAIPASWKD